MQGIANLSHIFILLWAAWDFYGVYEKHEGSMGSLRSKLVKEKKAFTKRKKELAVVKKFESQKQDAQSQFDEVEAEFEVIRKKLPSKLNNIENKQIFINIANKLNLKDPTLEDRLKEVNKGFYFLKKYKFKSKGTFLQFLIMLERVSESERLFNINSVQFKESSKKSRGRFRIINTEIIIEAYRYNDKFKSEAEKLLEAKKKKKGKKGKKKRRRRRKK